MSFFEHILTANYSANVGVGEGAGGGPEPLAVSDFKNGVYSINGVSKTLAEMWDDRFDDEEWYSFDASDVVAGIGLRHVNGTAHTFRGPAATPALLAAIGNSFTVVFDAYFTRSDTHVGAYGLGFSDLPGYNDELFFNQNTEGGGMFDYTTFDPSGPYPSPIGVWQRTAINFDLTGPCAFSIDGGPVVQFIYTPTIPLENFVVCVGSRGLIDGNPAAGTFESIISEMPFYPLQDEADLPALSA